MTLWHRGMAPGLLSLVLALVLGTAAHATPAITATYSYDGVGRLVSVVYSDGHSITYSYDPAGNRTEVVVD